MAALIGSAAGAQCPTSADLAGGVRVQYRDGYSIITRDDQGVVTEEEHSGEDVYQYVTENGVLETGYIETAAGISDRFSYTFDTSKLLPLDEWSGQAGEQITLNEAGVEVERVAFSYHTRGQLKYSIGACTFDSIAFQTFQRYPDGTSMVEFQFLLDLGVPVVVGFGGDGVFDSYPPQSISVEEN